MKRNWPHFTERKKMLKASALLVYLDVANVAVVVGKVGNRLRRAAFGNFLHQHHLLLRSNADVIRVQPSHSDILLFVFSFALASIAILLNYTCSRSQLSRDRIEK